MIVKTPNKFVSVKSKLNSLTYTKEIIDYCDSRLDNNINKVAMLTQKYNIASGHFELSDYKYILNPYDEDVSRNYAEKLRNWDFISPLFAQLTGEFLNRPLEPVVFNRNSDLDNIKSEFELQAIFESLQQTFVNILIEQGMFDPDATDEQTGQPVEPPQHPEQIKADVSTIVDQKAIDGQRVLNYIFDDQGIYAQLLEAWYNFIVTNTTFSYKDVVDDEVVYKAISPYNIDWVDDPDLEYIEDAEIIRYTNFYTVDRLFEMFQDEPGYKTIDKALRNKHVSTNQHYAMWRNNYHGYNRHAHFPSTSMTELIKFEHYQYTDYRKVYRIYTIDLVGNPIFYDVDEDYLPNEGEQLEERWIRQTWECFRLAGKYVIKTKPVDHQRAKFSNPSIAKKSYNGVVYKKQHPEIKTLSDKLKDYQETYNTTKFRLHATINKHKGSLALLPIGLFQFWAKKQVVVEEDGEEKIVERIDPKKDAIAEGMYYAEATNILFVDEQMEGLDRIVNMIKTLDFGMGTYIKDMLEICSYIKGEAEELIGFNRFRKANIAASDAVTNVNTGQYAGSLITEEYFFTFNNFLEKECQGIIDIAKYAYRNGKKAAYMRDDSAQEILNVDPGSIQESEYGVFVKNGGKTKEKMDAIKQLGLTLAQNGMKGSIITETINTDSNIEKIIEKMKIAERELEMSQQQQHEDQMAVMQEQNEILQQRLDDETFLKKYEIDENNQTKIDLKIMELSQMAINQNNTSALQELGILFAENRKDLDSKFAQRVKQIELSLKAQELELKNKDIDTRLEVSKDNKYIAKINKN